MRQLNQVGADLHETRTVVRVERLRSLSQSRAAGRAPEALPVEVEPLGTDSFDHVNALGTAVTLFIRLRKCPPY